MPLFSLAYLTYAPKSAAEAVSLAARLGYDTVGLRIRPSAPGGEFQRLIEEPALLRETLDRLSDNGVGVFDVEIVRLGPGFRPDSVRPFLDVCAALGARAVLVAGDDPDERALTASFAAFCETAAPYGLTGDLEFMPWTNVQDARTARRIAEGTGQPNARVLVDTLHVARSATSLADIAAIPASLLSYAQICDAPSAVPGTDEELIHTARQARLIPGDGGIDLVGMFMQLPPDLPVSVEVPNVEGIAQRGGEAWAAAALAAAKSILHDAVARGGSLRARP